MTIKRSEKYDAYYDDETNEWTEPKCLFDGCETCKGRPDKPLVGKTMLYHKANSLLDRADELLTGVHEDCLKQSPLVRSWYRSLMVWLVSALKFSFVYFGAFLPLQVFMDYGMGIVLFRDYSDLTVLGFIVCVVFYGAVIEKYSKG